MRNFEKNKINFYYFVIGDDVWCGLIEYDFVVEGVGVREVIKGVGGGRFL